MLTQLLDDWQDQRKPARVLLLVDVSGSMGEVADPDTGATKLDLAKSAAISALDDFNDDDEVGPVGLHDGPHRRRRQPHRAARARPDRAGRRRRRGAPGQAARPRPAAGHTAVLGHRAAYEDQVESYDPTRINAVVLLSDGVNDDGEPDDDREQLQSLLDTLTSDSEGQQSQEVRVFPISYGSSADLATLRRIAEASQAAVYDSSDPRSINKVFVAVVCNF